MLMIAHLWAHRRRDPRQVEKTQEIPVINSMQAMDLQEILDLHIESFPDSFLTLLGRPVLSLIYEQLIQEGYGYVYREGDDLAGFLAGMYVTSKEFYQRIFRKQPVRVPALFLGAAIHDLKLFVPILKRFNLLYLKPSIVTTATHTPEYEFIVRNQGLIAAALTMAVSPRHRGKGIAKKLWKYLLLDLPKREVDAIWASVLESNDATNGMYRQLQFKVIGRIPRADGDFEMEWLAYKKGDCTVMEDGRVWWNDARSPTENP